MFGEASRIWAKVNLLSEVKILVTGAAGFIGSVVTERLVSAGHSVFAFDSLKYGHQTAVHPDAEFVHGDLTEAAMVRETLGRTGVEAVMHLAAEAYIDESVKNPGLFFRVNTAAGLHLLEAMRDLAIRKIVFSSTAAVYGDAKVMPITEDAPCEPVNAYGESKLQFERTMAWFHRSHGLNHVSLRYFNACGASKRCGEDRKKETHIIPILFNVAMGKGPKFSLFGTDYNTPDGTCVRDYVHVEDIADAHILALERIEELGERAYNLGSGVGYSNLQVIEAAREVTGANIVVGNAPRRDGDPATLIASNEKIAKELGWGPQWTDLAKMVASSWAWRQAHPEGYAG